MHAHFIYIQDSYQKLGHLSPHYRLKEFAEDEENYYVVLDLVKVSLRPASYLCLHLCG
jgi:hypothetical protein